jgi:hypothetical protein
MSEPLNMELILEQRREELRELERLLGKIHKDADFNVQWQRVMMERRQKLDRAIDAIRELERYV